jgi:hypothetical protein
MSGIIGAIGYWRTLVKSYHGYGKVLLVLGSLGLGITIQWLWIENECGLGNLFANPVGKCRDNGLRLVFGGPLVLFVNLLVSWAAFQIIEPIAQNSAEHEKWMSGIVLAVAAPGILIIMIPAGKALLPFLLIIVIALEFYCYVRYLHTLAKRLSDAMLIPLQTGVKLIKTANTISIQILHDSELLDCRTAKLRILDCLKSMDCKKIELLAPTAACQSPEIQVLMKWLYERSTQGSVPFSVVKISESP